MPSREPDSYAGKPGRKANLRLPPIKDPTPKAVAGRGQVGGHDYTKYIRWTPARIAVFSIFVVTPYLIAVGALWFKFGFGAALGLLVLGIGLGAFIALMYWFANSSL